MNCKILWERVPTLKKEKIEGEPSFGLCSLAFELACSLVQPTRGISFHPTLKSEAGKREEDVVPCHSTVL